MGDFYLTLPSNSSMNHYPNNSSSHFFTILPQSFDLSRQYYEVGLAEIQFPNSYTDINNGWIQISETSDSPIRKLFLPGKVYDSIEVLVSNLNMMLSPKYNSDKTDTDFMEVSYDKTSRLVSICLNQEGSQLRLSPELGDILGMNDAVLYGPGKFTGSVMTDIHKNSNTMYIYCDLVTHRQVGDMLVPLLRIIPTHDKSSDIIHRIFEKPHYLSLNRHQFHSIEIIFKTDTGRSPTFLTGTSVITLHFRERKKN